MSEWKAFSAFAVDYLGIPVAAMPLYSQKKEWSCKGKKLLSNIIESGNFGHNKDISYQQTSGYFVRKIISLWRITVNSTTCFLIFPLDSIKVWGCTFKEGMMRLFQGWR